MDNMFERLIQLYEDFCWWQIKDENLKESFKKQLIKETGPESDLFSIMDNLVAVAKSDRQDDVLFSDGDNYFVVHLTYNTNNSSGFVEAVIWGKTGEVGDSAESPSKIPTLNPSTGLVKFHSLEVSNTINGNINSANLINVTPLTPAEEATYYLTGPTSLEDDKKNLYTYRSASIRTQEY